jgi:hypothetical protein
MKKQSAEEIKKYSQKWYTFGRSFLPEFGTPQFGRIAGNSNTFAYNINAGNEGEISIRLSSETETAYVDLETKTIYISEKYFSSELYEKRFGDDVTKIERLAIALINGSTIHESLHIQHTKAAKDIPSILENHDDYELMVLEYGQNLVCTTFNIIEDLYIDSKVPKNLAQWLQNRAEILFPESGLNEMDLSDPTIGDYISLAVYFKNKALRSNNQFDAFPPETFIILRKVSGGIYMSQYERINYAFEFLLSLPITRVENDDSGDNGSEKGEASVGSEIEKILAGIEKMDGKESEAIASEIAEESDEVAKAEMKTESFGWMSWKRLVEVDVLNLRSLFCIRKIGSKVNPTTDINFSFLKELQAIRTLNRTPGQARNRGSVMVKSRLTRIATDGKIFAKADSKRHTLKRMEVIINIDYSASTNGMIINNELGAAKEMSRVLKAARIAHSVYGHTSTGDGSTPLLIHIYSYDMKETNHDWTNRFEKATRVDLSENYDGVVIAALREKFTGKKAAQYIINLSDGTPQGPGYSGKDANNHTKVEIANSRKVGIGVFSISVVSGVVRDNNEIYGREFNIDGSRNVNSQFGGLIRKLMGG